MARLTKASVVTYFQSKGAKVHFNQKTIEDPVWESMTENKQKEVSLRYGVVEYSELVKDLQTWETLLGSSFMQRPHQVLVQAEEDVY